MEKYTFARRTLSAMPTTPDDIVFLAAVFVAFFSGALLLDWIRRVRDVGLQKQWHDAQMRTLLKGFALFEQIPQQLNAISASVGELREKADGAADRFNTLSDRVDDLSQNFDRLQDVGVDTYDIKGPSIVQSSRTVNFADANELLVAIKLHIKSLESKMSEMSKQKDELEQANVSLKEDLERATKSDRMGQSDEYKRLLMQNEELQAQVAQTEHSVQILEQEKGRLAANSDLAMKQQEEVIDKHETDIEGLEERLASAQNDRNTTRDEMEQMLSELVVLKSKLSVAQSDYIETEQENERLSSVISDLETRLSSAREDQERMAQEIKTHLAEIKRLQDDLSSAEHVVNPPVAPVVEASGRSAARKSWADDENQDLDTEIQKFSARTASLPSALSSTNSPAQEDPDSPAAKPQPAIDISVGNFASAATVANSNATPLPATPSSTSDMVTAHCFNCKTGVPVERIQLPNGMQCLDWRKHLKETGCKTRATRASSQAQSGRGSAPISPAASSPGGFRGNFSNPNRSTFSSRNSYGRGWDSAPSSPNTVSPGGHRGAFHPRGRGDFHYKGGDSGPSSPIVQSPGGHQGSNNHGGRGQPN